MSVNLPERWILPLSVLAFAVLAYLYLCLAPLPPPPVGTGIDPSWVWALNLAHRDHLTFGQDIVFTYGPLGRIMMPTLPITPLLSYIALITFFYASIGAALLRIWLAFRPNLKAFLAPAVALLALLILCGYHVEYQDGALALVACAAIIASPRYPHAMQALLTVLIAIVFSGKFNSFVLGFGLQVMLAIVLTLRERRFWKPSLAWLAASLCASILFFLSLNQWTGLLGYVKGALELSSGYSEAMSVIGPAGTLLLAIATCAAIYLVIPLLSEDPKALLPGLLPALVITFLAFKHAFVRQDDHQLAFQAKITFACLFPLLLARTRRDILSYASVAALSCLVSLGFHMDARADMTSAIRDRLTFANASDYVRMVFNARERTATIWAESEKGYKLGVLDPATLQLIGNRTVDIHPIRIDMIPINNLKWRPRPVIAEYSAYTPYLDALNAEQIIRNGAERIVLRREDLDGRIQLMEDPQTASALLNWYDVLLINENHVLLGRRAQPRYDAPKPLARTIARWATPIPVPAPGPNEVIVMRAHIRQTLSGKLTTLFLRAAPVNLSMQTSNGTGSLGRIIWRNLSAGTQLFPRPITSWDNAAIFEGPEWGLSPRIETVRFDTPGLSQFQSEIEIEWLTQRLRQPQPVDSSKILSSLEPIWKPGEPASLIDATILDPKQPELLQATTIDPQILIATKDLRPYRSIVAKVRLVDPEDRIELFFNHPSAARRVFGAVPVQGKDLDVVFNVGAHPEWDREPVTQIRLDPRAHQGRVIVKGIWGSKVALEEKTAQIVALPSN